MRATVIFLGCALLAAPARAQDGPVYVGGSVLFVSTSAPAPDAAGSGYLRPNFHGSLDWPVAGLGVNGGVFLNRHWDLRGELVLRRAASAQISEDEQSGHFDFRQLMSRYESSERLLSALAGRRVPAGSKVDLHAVGGFSVSFATQRLMDRRGTSSSGYGTRPIDAPDVSVRTTSCGVVGGGDVVIGTSSAVAFVGGARLLWFRRTSTQSVL